MRENRMYGSEGGGTGIQPVLPTPIVATSLAANPTHVWTIDDIRRKERQNRPH